MSSHDPIHVHRPGYTWDWSPVTDEFTVIDPRGLTVLIAPLQPVVVLERARPQSGVVSRSTLSGDVLTVEYDGVNGSDRMRVVVRFDGAGVWFDPAEYESRNVDEVVSTLAFASADGRAVPGIASDYLVHPGASESSVLGPVIPAHLRLELTTWLGRGSHDGDGIVSAQWGLPVHYLAGFSIDGSMCEAGALTRGISASFCLGLTEIPTGDLLLRQSGGRVSPWLRTHSDLWHHQTTGSGPITVGASWLLTVADSYDDAIRGYYRALVAAGIVRTRPRTPAQLATLRRPQFNTWGAQCAQGTAAANFTQDALQSIYDDARSHALAPGIFVIDDKWEGEYGLLEHDAERFPLFEEFLDRVRADGLQIGLWAAFLRCDDPASHGLGVEHMLCDVHGVPVVRGNPGSSYYLFDVSQEPVREVLADRARRFVRRYRPSLVKFDFGYELPAMVNAAPRERSWGGEKLLLKALELVIGAMREVDPDLVVMYYNLSPLLADFVDLHSLDDMFLNADEYQLEANRRLFFSSLLGEVGVPSYGSGGYDWLQMPEIWLDTVAFGPIGSLGAFHGDPRDSAPSEREVALYHGFAALSRPGTAFQAKPLTPAYLGGSSGARSGSWARSEGGEVTAVVNRPNRYDGSGVSVPQSIVRSPVPVAVVSLADRGLESTDSLGIVVLAAARVEILRRDAGHVVAIAHSSDGGAHPLAVELTPEGFALDIPSRAALSPVEWVEVTLPVRGGGGRRG